MHNFYTNSNNDVSKLKNEVPNVLTGGYEHRHGHEHLPLRKVGFNVLTKSFLLSRISLIFFLTSYQNLLFVIEP